MTVVLNNIKDFENLIQSCRDNGMEDWSDEMISIVATAVKESNLSVQDIAANTGLGKSSIELITLAKSAGVNMFSFNN